MNFRSIATVICLGLVLVLMVLSVTIDCTDTGDPTSYDSSIPPDSKDEPDPESKDEQLVAPNELSVIRLNDTSVVLRWEFPDEMQEQIVHFKVQFKSTRKNSVWKTDNVDIPAIARAHQINGLKPGNYFFSVVAIYDNQDNAVSTSLKYKLKATGKIDPADMPEMKAPSIYWHEAETEYFRFKWHYEPKISDNEDFGFLVYYRPVHKVPFNIYNTMGTNVEIAELEPDTAYEAKVVAYNENGISEFSDTITIRTKPAKNETLTTLNATMPTTTRPPTTPLVMPHDFDSTRPKTTLSYNESIINFFKPIFSDTMLVVRYLLLVLLPILFITFGLILCLRSSASRPPPTNDTEFNLEINGYFKNSFPGFNHDTYK
jgi:hypothetical protein